MPIIITKTVSSAVYFLRLSVTVNTGLRLAFRNEGQNWAGL